MHFKIFLNQIDILKYQKVWGPWWSEASELSSICRLVAHVQSLDSLTKVDRAIL